MLLAAEAPAAVQHFHFLDIIMITFSIIIAIGVFRLVKSPVRNLFAIGFGSICLLVFVVVDVLVVMNWMGMLA